MTTAFTRTRNQLADLVLGKLGVNAAGQTSISADADLVYEAIDLRLKEMHRLGIFWRKVTSVPVTFSLTAGIVSASAGAGDILFPLKVTFTNGTGDDPVEIIGFRQYAEIPDKTRSGQPLRALWKGGTEFIFHPVPSANGTAKLLYEKIADDTANATAPDVDVAMLRSLKDAVAYDVADHYGIPEQKMMRWAQEAQLAERHIRFLSAPRTDFATVQVDDSYGSRPVTQSDY